MNNDFENEFIEDEGPISEGIRKNNSYMTISFIILVLVIMFAIYKIVVTTKEIITNESTEFSVTYDGEEYTGDSVNELFMNIYESLNSNNVDNNIIININN